MSPSKPRDRVGAAPKHAPLGVMREERPESGVRPKARASVDVTLWGTPLDPAYRQLYRELEVFARPTVFELRHRHHGFAGFADESAFVVAELIEVANTFSRRAVALRWFVAHGRAGLLPPRILGTAIDVDPEALQRAFFEGAGMAAVENDLRLASGFAPSNDLLVTVGADLAGVEAKLWSVLAAVGRTCGSANDA